MTSLYTVILAAGGSRRLGQPKQLLRKQRETLLLRSLRIAHGITPHRVVLVLGAQRLRLRLAIGRWHCPPTRIVDNGRWPDGMGTSLDQGLRALPPACGAALLLLVDQPGITRRGLQPLLRVARRHPQKLVASWYSGRPGVPAIIPRRYWRELRRLGGDQGARGLLRSRRSELVTVPMPEAAWDIDEPGDLASL